MSLTGVAKQTLAILDCGYYDHPETGRVEFAGSIKAAIEGTILYRPPMLPELLAPRREPGSSTAQVRVSADTTQVAAHRLAANGDVLVLNFASAKNPGGGFESGAKAQEEDLARCSALVLCQRSQFDYYRSNRGERSMIYTDHLIYSPSVPFFRVKSRTLLPRPFLASVITAPAPNTGEHLRRVPDGLAEAEAALERRAGYVLAIAKHHGHKQLVLGAWGCGVFRNRPAKVAEVFASWLDDQQFADAFERVEFAVYDKSKSQANQTAFREHFSRF